MPVRSVPHRRPVKQPVYQRIVCQEQHISEHHDECDLLLQMPDLTLDRQIGYHNTEQRKERYQVTRLHAVNVRTPHRRVTDIKCGYDKRAHHDDRYESDPVESSAAARVLPVIFVCGEYA